jgi:uncharacterized protein YndB with AHSA1/START domain
MIDVTQQIAAARRSLGAPAATGELRTLTIAQTYDTDLDDLWDACTNPERIPRWFLPVTGDLVVGGRYQLEGNAGGTIEACDAPHSFKATWEYGDAVSWIEVVLATDPAGGTRFELRHTAPIEEHWDQFGPGAVGIGWDLGFIGLTLHLASGGAQVDPAEVMAWTVSEEGLRFMTESSQAWCEADVASGEDAETARRRADATLAAYTEVPEPEAE